jgi:hypothetical protein
MSRQIQAYMERNIKESPNFLVPYYLMCSYTYYELDFPLVGDSFFDKMAKTLLKSYDSISHPHKKLITKGMLEAGTYFGKYPEIVKGATKDLMQIYGVR